MNIKVSLFAVVSLIASTANALELLDLPSAQNRQANKSVLLAMQLSSAGITLVGEREIGRASGREREYVALVAQS